MKIKIKILLVAFILCFNLVDGQEKSKKELKEEKKLNKQKEVDTLVESKVFNFEASFVQPLGRGQLNIQGQGYEVKYSRDQIESFLPYFGRAFNIGYGGDSGLNFKGSPEEFTIEKKKKHYLIKTTIKAKNDTFLFSLYVYFDGNASLTVNSNQRQSISYTGIITENKKKE